MASFERYRERPVLITGSSRGIGEAIARQLHHSGALVTGCARLGRDNAPFPEYSVDVSNGNAVAELAATVRRAHGALDLVVHCAGILGPRLPLMQTDASDLQRVLDINLMGSFHVAKEAYPLLSLGRRPLLVLMSSSVGRKGRATWGPYAISKHGVEGLATTLADEWQDDLIGVWSVNPGATATDMRAEAMPGEDPATLPSADAVASTVLGAAVSFDLSQTGWSWDVRDRFTG